MKHTIFTSSVITVVRTIPEGSVATYGDVATWVGRARAARAVGSALRGLNEATAQDIPWQRVINAQGRVSMGATPHRALRQRTILQAEGIRFDRDGSLDLERYRWTPPASDVEAWIAAFQLQPGDIPF